jgi:hypothetical protein
MMNALVGKLQKTHNLLNRKKIENIITMVLHTIKTEVTSAMTQTKYHLHHMIVNAITINDLTMIVADHLRKIAPAPKRAVRAAQATATKIITDKAYHTTMKRKDTKHQHRNL